MWFRSPVNICNYNGCRLQIITCIFSNRKKQKIISFSHFHSQSSVESRNVFVDRRTDEIFPGIWSHHCRSFTLLSYRKGYYSSDLLHSNKNVNGIRMLNLGPSFCHRTERNCPESEDKHRTKRDDQKIIIEQKEVEVESENCLRIERNDQKIIIEQKEVEMESENDQRGEIVDQKTVIEQKEVESEDGHRTERSEPESEDAHRTESDDSESEDAHRTEWDDPESEDEVVNVIFVDQVGKETTVRGKIGDNLMYLAHRYSIDIEGSCEAKVTCSTCHVYIDETSLDKLDEMDVREEDMLDSAPFLKTCSRLACQIILRKDFDGIRVTLPLATRNFYVDGFRPQPH